MTGDPPRRLSPAARQRRRSEPATAPPAALPPAPEEAGYLVIEAPERDVVARLDANFVAREIAGRLPYMAIVRNNDTVFEFGAPIVGQANHDEIARLAEARKLVAKRFKAGEVFYSPRTNTVIVAYKDGSADTWSEGRVRIGQVDGGHWPLAKIQVGERIRARAPVYSIAFDRALKPVKSAGASLYGYTTIVGTAVTLLGAIDPLLVLARWAKRIVAGWYAAIDFVWSKIGALLSIHIPPSLRLWLTIGVFLLYMSIFSNLSNDDDRLDYDQYRSTLARVATGMIVVSAIVFAGGLQRSGLETVDPLNVVGPMIVLSCGVVGILVGNLRALNGRLWRSIFLFAALVGLGISDGPLEQLRSMIWIAQ